ncbi:MAG: hypothetical protein KKE23_04545 [Nanoarchaeota archaeon]|nr:hypothetical protein [Nanoarchaeota archaeon]
MESTKNLAGNLYKSKLGNNMMMHFLKRVIDEKVDDAAHQQFVRFSKGIFENRAVFKVRKSDKIKFNSTFEMANDMVMLAASATPKMHCTGLILSKETLPFTIKKKGLATVYEIDQDMESSRIHEIAQKAYFMLLDCEGMGVSLKIKKKLPKPNPKGADGKVNDKFCVMELDGKNWGNMKEEFLYGLPEGKKYEISHQYNIQEIILPVGEKDPEQMRLKAKRKGIVKRKAIVDGKEIVNESKFIA